MPENKVLKATFWYTFSNFLLKGLIFLTTPIFARILTKAEFGSFSNYTAWHGFAGIVITLSLLPSLARGRFDFKDDLSSFVASNLILGSIATFIFSLIIFFNIDFFTSLFVLKGKYIFIICLTLLFSPAYDMFMAIQRFSYKYKTVAILTVFISVSSILLSLILIYFMKDHLLARVLGNTIPSLTVAVSIYAYFLFQSGVFQSRLFQGKLFQLRRQTVNAVKHAESTRTEEKTGKTEKLENARNTKDTGRILGTAKDTTTPPVIKKWLKYWKYSLLISVPYIFHLLSGSVLSQSDRAMITSICGAEDTALYSMAYNVSLAVNVLWSSMNSAFGPWLGEKLIAFQYEPIKKHTRPYLAIFAVLIVFLMLIAPEALLFLGGRQYLEAKYVIPPVMVGCYFIFVYSMYVNVEQFEKRTAPMAVATFCAALSNLLLNWLSIPLFGYIAAAYTTLFCYFLLWLFHYFLVRRMGLHIIYDTKFIVTVSIAVCLVMFLSLWLYQMTVIRYVVLVSYVGALGYMGLKNKEKIMVYFGKAGEN